MQNSIGALFHIPPAARGINFVLERYTSVNCCAALKQLVKPCPNDWLTAVEISSLVNSPNNNTPEVLQPVGMTGVQLMDRLFDD
jgi:hypothetical protein